MSNISIDWLKVLDELRHSSDEDVDDIIDDATGRMEFEDPPPETTRFLIDAVGRAQSDLSLRSAALNLAVIAEADNYEAAQVLISAYERVAGHRYLAPALLDALGVLALRNAVARSLLTTQLLLLQRHTDEHLLTRAIKWIGRLDGLRADPDLAAKLQELLTADDLGVQAEARQQLALMLLRDALLAQSRDELFERLIAARAAFARAAMSDEHRPDARSLIILIDMMLAFMRLGRERDIVLAALERLSAELIDLLRPFSTFGWWDYCSDRSTLRMMGVLRVSDALTEGARAINKADEWMNFIDALEALARLYAQIRAESVHLTNLPLTLDGVSDTVFADSLGPLLIRAVNKRRLEIALDRYIVGNGEDETSRGLRALMVSAMTTTFASDPDIPEDLILSIAQMAARRGTSPDSLLKEFVEAVDSNTVLSWAESISSPSLVVERIELYGADKAIDEVVRPLLRQLRDRLGTYDQLKWARLASVLTTAVSFVQLVRDVMPDYVKRLGDNGLGQNASEDHLQEGFYEFLRREFGTAVDYEPVRIGGGRPDIVVKFPEARFPIEVKHEFNSIDPEHIRKNFIYQADFYAAATDRVSFLMILDLRSGNAADLHPEHTIAPKAGSRLMPNPLYHLSDCFRIESLPTDPDMPNATTKTVVVGLVQGNRPLPSSMSTYSRRPRTSRAGR